MHRTLKRAQRQIGRSLRQARQILTEQGFEGLNHKVRSAAADWFRSNDALALPVRRMDVLAADLARPFRPTVPEVLPDKPIVVNWVTTPSGPHSGGHTTLFRIIGYLQAHGYTNRVYFYDVYGGDHEYYRSVAQEYYGFEGDIHRMDDGMDDAHCVVATAWPTAYPVFNSRCSGERFYFVQDFEPYFYPVGSVSFLAESTYRMGFKGITIGKCFARKLETEFRMPVQSFEFGCDRKYYFRQQHAKRSGIVFYAKPQAARRGCELGLMALEVFAKRNPHIDIHIYGEKIGKVPFRCVDHGRVSPEKLNGIYNSCYAALSLSLTNVSLVVNEILAAGCIPIVNDSELVRMDLSSPYVRYVQPYPHILATALESVVKDSDFESLSKKAASSVQSSSWEQAGAKVDEIFRHSLMTNSNGI